MQHEGAPTEFKEVNVSQESVWTSLSKLSQIPDSQAELDHHVRDTYNYVTVQADIVMPGRQLAVLEDAYRQARAADVTCVSADAKNAASCCRAQNTPGHVAQLAHDPSVCHAVTF